MRDEMERPILQGAKLNRIINQELREERSDKRLPSERTQKEEEIVKGKLSKFPKRLQYLIEDLAYLETADFIHPWEWDATWRQIDDVFEKNNVCKDEIVYDGPSEREQTSLELGIQLGHIARLFMQNGSSKFQEDELGIGLLLGLYGKFMNQPESLVGQDTDQQENSSSPGPREGAVFNLKDEGYDQIKNDLSRLKHQLSIRANIHTHPAYESFEKVTEASDIPNSPAIHELIIDNVDEVERKDKKSVTTVYHESVKIIKREKREEINQAKQFADEVMEDISQLIEPARPTNSNTPLYPAEILHAISTTPRKLSGREIKEQVQNSRRDDPGAIKIGSIKDSLKGAKKETTRWERYPLIKKSNYGYELTKLGELFAIITVPESNLRESNKHLPTGDGERFISDISKEDIETVCYACALGIPSERRSKIFKGAYKQRMQSDDNQDSRKEYLKKRGNRFDSF